MKEDYITFSWEKEMEEKGFQKGLLEYYIITQLPHDGLIIRPFSVS
jgi:hypothetical protein